jgi:serine/threonine protein phosphatase PrpC
MTYTLTEKDKWCFIGSDGFWDMISMKEALNLVQSYRTKFEVFYPNFENQEINFRI